MEGVLAEGLTEDWQRLQYTEEKFKGVDTQDQLWRKEDEENKAI